MGKVRGGNITTSDIATEGSVSINSATATLFSAVDANRTYLEISNPSNQAVWIKLQAASVDNVKTGIYLPGGERWVMGDLDKYTGEVSAIMNIGGAVLIHKTEM